MDVKTYINILKDLKTKLTKKELENIQANSFYNFLIYYEQLKGNNVRNKVELLIEEYFEIIKNKDYKISNEESNEFWQKYLMKIGENYHCQLGFKICMKFQSALLLGIVIDVILFLFGVLDYIYYIPISTIFFIGYNRYLYTYYSKRNKLYGSKY